MSDEAATAHLARAAEEIVESNGRAYGDYLIAGEINVSPEGILFSWRWAWSPKAPENRIELK